MRLHPITGRIFRGTSEILGGISEEISGEILENHSKEFSGESIEESLKNTRYNSKKIQKIISMNHQMDS